MVVAGLTGGIATGKSTVAAFFVSAGAELIDADRIAFDAVQKGTAVWQEIVEHFGQGVLLPVGQIDRARLGNIIFHDHEQKAVLKELSPDLVTAEALAGETIRAKLTRAPGNDAPIGGLKVVTENGWFAARPSGTEDIYKLYAESFNGPEHLRKIQEEGQAIVDAAFEKAGV